MSGGKKSPVRVDACYDLGIKVYPFLSKMVSEMTELLNPKIVANVYAVFFSCMILVLYLGHGIFSSSGIVAVIVFFVDLLFSPK